MKKVTAMLTILTLLMVYLPIESLYARPIVSRYGGLQPPEQVSKNFLNKLKRVVGYFRKIQLSQTTPLHDNYFGVGHSGRVYLDFIRQSIDNLKVDDSAETGVLAYVLQSKVGTMYLSNQLVELDFSDPVSKVTFLSALVHEAWHSYGRKKFQNMFRHVLCPEKDLEGFPLIGHISHRSLQGKPACDLTPDGAYGVQSIMLYNIGRFCTNCSEEEKEAALFLFKEMSRRIIVPISYEVIVQDTSPQE